MGDPSELGSQAGLEPLAEAAHHVVVFRLDGQRYALSLPVVQRVVRAVEITLLPKAPAIVLGIINVGGKIIPVVNIRRRFGLPAHDISLADRFVIARTAERVVALIADCVDGVVQGERADVIAAARILPHLDYVEGVLKLSGGLIYIHDLDTFLSLDEEMTLQRALMPS